MFRTDDTIVAIATPPGRGGIGVVRVSGPGAERVARTVTDHDEPFTPRHATLTRVRARGEAVDQVVVTFFPAPHSYTAEHVVEISAHGSPVVLRAILAACTHAGARLAEPGEFTLRAFLHGRIDLVQAEAVRDLVDAVTPLQARAAFDQLEGTLTAGIRAIDERLFELAMRLEASLDFPEEGYHFVDAAGASAEIDALASEIGSLLRDSERGRLVREGATVVLAGKPNAGKSSLFNALAGAGRAIVTDVPGTTRDLLTEVVDIGGVPITLVDTAGVHGLETGVVEAEGIARARAARTVAEIVVVVLDASQPLAAEDRAVLAETAAMRRVVVANKSDLPRAWTQQDEVLAVPVSARTGEGLDDMRRALAHILSGDSPQRDTPAVTNVRHVELLRTAREALARAADAVRTTTPEEFVLQDLHAARAALEEVTGKRTADDLLAAIFSRFCIGK